MSTRRKTATAKEADPALGKTFDFTAADLKANQGGELSARQKERLAEMGRKAVKYAGFGIKFFVVFVTLAGGLLFLMLSKSSGFSGSDQLVFLAVLPLPILILAGYYLVTKKQRVRYDNPRLLMTEGVAQVKRKGSKYGTYIDVGIGSFHTHMLDEYVALIKKGTQYRVYYVVVSKFPTMLSIEESG